MSKETHTCWIAAKALPTLIRPGDPVSAGGYLIGRVAEIKELDRGTMLKIQLENPPSYS